MFREAKEESYWVAYNIEYIMGSAFPGDNEYVIMCDYMNPFSEAGSYYINYVETGETLNLVDSKGFQSETPVLYLVTDTSHIQEDWEDYTNNEMQLISLQEELCQLLKPDSDNEEENDTNHEPEQAGEETYASDENFELAENPEYILSNSDQRHITQEEIDQLSAEELRLAINEIYARHGRKFASEDLKQYFSSKSWYNGTIEADQFDENVLNQYEKDNIAQLVKKRDQASEAGNQFIGTWWDMNSLRCHMDINHIDSNRFNIEIEWGSGADTNTEWYMTGTYNDERGDITYSDCVMQTVQILESGESAVLESYENGRGNFIISDGYLYWNDEMENAGANCYFQKDSN